MDPSSGQPSQGGDSSRWLPKLAFVASAALAALALRLAWEEPIGGAVGLVLLLAVIGARWYGRRRTAQVLRSGDVESVLQRWSSSVARIPHPETMGPLMTATAFAAYGWVSRAREVLRSAERGPAWEAALEHRLFLDSLLLTFEGDSDGALERAAELDKLPLPASSPTLVDRVRVLRGAVAALARAFAHAPRDGDRHLLIAASQASPLVHWAMRYGAAIVSVDAGDLSSARLLVADAPDWPQESCFSGFHSEIVHEVERREGVGGEVEPAAPSAGPHQDSDS